MVVTREAERSPFYGGKKILNYKTKVSAGTGTSDELGSGVVGGEFVSVGSGSWAGGFSTIGSVLEEVSGGRGAGSVVVPEFSIGVSIITGVVIEIFALSKRLFKSSSLTQVVPRQS